MLFYRFPLKIGQKSAYNQRKVVIFYKFPLKIEYFLLSGWSGGHFPDGVSWFCRDPARR